ncbi:carbamoyl-phosphate synthase (glutamine-hydrolyzing) large subunit [Candidatus Microgenomates bacterium]|nr:MAG: carbamoyl-phosphate synthase (glutamine-hydrolyzing) large subunit [Candidatus Microgenomates bacterium]
MNQIKKVLLLGSGALKIGEAGEFDYSGTQAIKALKEEGKEVILVNPNVATIQTSEGLADKIYLLPVTADFVSRVIAKERPDGIMLSFGGQSALNCGIDLYRKNILKKYKVTILGTPIQAILDTEDRKLFSDKLHELGLKTAHGKTVTTLYEAVAFAKKIGYPVMLRTGFALGGTGSGILKNERELKKVVTRALSVFPQIIIEECLYGWKEVEYEVVRDCDDNCVTVCNMENFDPTGIHTGESIVVAPSQTLNDHEYYSLREISIRTIKSLKIIGECNIQFALHPKTGDYRIIEVNARLSRSSALASKATGYPLAYIAAKLSLGKRLWELPNTITAKTTAFFEPALDYIVVKLPRWDLDKYTHIEVSIGSEMKSVGEVMSIGRSFEEAIQKGARMLNDGYNGVIDVNFGNESKKELLERLKTPSSMRLFTILSALRAGITVDEIYTKTYIDPWFLEKLQNIVVTYNQLQKNKKLEKNLLERAKRQGFSDVQIADLFNTSESAVRTIRKKWNITPKVKRIDTLAGEFPAVTNYMYMTYNAGENDYIPDADEKKIVVVGGGPYAIGTSVEFDWCAVNTIATIKQHGYKGVMINCNPETVSTDYDHSDYLYFEELTVERFLDIMDLEKSPVVLSVGGQIPNNISQKIGQEIKILGPQPKQITRAENRQEFSRLLDRLNIAQPKWARAKTFIEARTLCKNIGYPVLLRPSFVLSGKAMRVIENESALREYMRTIPLDLRDHPILISQFFRHAQECDFDGVAQKGTILVSALCEHVEDAGVHSGDSSMMLPAPTLSAFVKRKVAHVAAEIVKELKITGPFNVQYVIQNEEVYVIECNLRASRSFPFDSKVTGVNFIKLATEILLGTKKKPISIGKLNHFGVKVPQFSFHKLKGADPVPKIEMNSTGEVAALATQVHQAYLTAILATGVKYPTKKGVFISLGGMDNKMRFIDAIKKLVQDGFTLYATLGTALYLKENNLASVKVGKLHEGAEVTAENLLREQKIDFAVVVPEMRSDRISAVRVKKGFTDGYKIRRLAIDLGIPVLTNVASGTFFVDAILNNTLDSLPIKALDEYR